MTKLKCRIIIISGILLVVAGGVLAAYNIWDDYRASSSATAILNEFNKQRDEVYDASGEGYSPDYVKNPNMPMPTIEVDGYRYIGTVVIPPLELELPVTEEWDYDRMKIAPCRYSGSVYLDNMVICAHNYSSQFRDIDDLQENDDVIFIDAAGNEFHYKVSEVETLNDTAVEDMVFSDWDFTMFTCNYMGDMRVTVRCNRVKE